MNQSILYNVCWRFCFRWRKRSLSTNVNYAESVKNNFSKLIEIPWGDSMIFFQLPALPWMMVNKWDDTQNARLEYFTFYWCCAISSFIIFGSQINDVIPLIDTSSYLHADQLIFPSLFHFFFKSETLRSNFQGICSAGLLGKYKKKKIHSNCAVLDVFHFLSDCEKVLLALKNKLEINRFAFFSNIFLAGTRVGIILYMNSLIHFKCLQSI